MFTDVDLSIGVTTVGLTYANGGSASTNAFILEKNEVILNNPIKSTSEIQLLNSVDGIITTNGKFPETLHNWNSTTNFYVGWTINLFKVETPNGGAGIGSGRILTHSNNGDFTIDNSVTIVPADPATPGTLYLSLIHI